MRLTGQEVEARLTAAWGKQAFVVPYRLTGNRYHYLVTDHSEHWLPLRTSWGPGGQVFVPIMGDWPGAAPTPDPWDDAVDEAANRARSYLAHHGSKAALKRLPKAVTLAKGQDWQRLGDRPDTWLIPSGTRLGVVYVVNGRCTCADYTEKGVKWCEHRQARALAKCAAGILRDRIGAGAVVNTPPPDPEGPHEASHSTTTPTNGQARRIDLVVAYEADDSKILPHTNGNGQLVTFQADGLVVEPPASTLQDLYRWLQDAGYVPNGFKWLGWERGLRRRLQSYVRTEDRDTALPVQYSRGRSKLFKEETR
jgi:hypothetical protein